jgi:L-2-hydroxyglutarate oxidase LhgO
LTAPEVDVAVVGGGVLGLAAAAALALAGRSLVLLEREDGFAREMTSRNSEVVHAGLYYPTGSLKASLCVRGRELLYERCRRLGISHRVPGKLVVATNASERELLEELWLQGSRNGVPGLELLDAASASRLEPDVRCTGALLSPSTGIVDGHAFALSFAAEAEAHDAVLATGADVMAMDPVSSGYRIHLGRRDGSPETLDARAVVNAAGLDAPRIFRLAGGDPKACGYRLHPCKGDYFALAPGAPLHFSHLVYPVPAGPGLGIHAPFDLAGRIRFGPDAKYVERPRYDVDAGKAEQFAAAVRRYVPSLESAWLSPDYAGVRPKLSGPGEEFRDFVVREESDRGLPGFVNLIGIESPGLTAAPAIAERVVELLAGHFG